MAEVASFVDGLLDDAANDLNVWMLHRRPPHSPDLPEALRDRPALIVAVTYTGKPANAERAVAPLRTFREPLLDHVRWRSYPEWQRALDGAWGEGLCNEWVGHYLDA
jgi:hypothetical protein